MAPKSLENRIRRLEILVGIESVPSDWGITKTRKDNLKNKGVKEHLIQDKLVLALGENIPEEINAGENE